LVAEVLKMVQKGKKVQKKKGPKNGFFFIRSNNQHRGANAYSQAVNPKKNSF
jgi:hypothetical protein